MITLTSIHLFPVKGARAIDCQQITLDRFGPVGDRRWMVVDPEGRFVSQRECPLLAKLDALPTDAGIMLGFEGQRHQVVQPGDGAPRREVQIWADTVSAADAGDEIAHWLTDRLQRPLRLVHMPEQAQRLVNPEYAREGETVSFADGFPLLLVSRAAIDELNNKLTQKVGMDRFRPNLVVDGCAAHAEDDWQRIRIGETTFTVAKPCARCTVPAFDQRTGEKHPELLRTLASYRRAPDRKVYFGQNLLYGQAGTLRVGDPVEVL